MVGDLPEAVAFQVELRAGRLMALHADSYGQDTRAVDFITAPFDEVFYLDADGASVLYDPAVAMPDSPLLDLHRHDDPPIRAYDPYVDPAAPPLDPQVARAVERIKRFRQPADQAPSAEASITALAASPAVRWTLRVAHVVTGLLFVVALLGVWGPLHGFWDGLGIDDPFLWFLVPFFAIGFLRKQVETPKP